MISNQGNDADCYYSSCGMRAPWDWVYLSEPIIHAGPFDKRIGRYYWRGAVLDSIMSRHTCIRE
jgi:hypothetical protein